MTERPIIFSAPMVHAIRDDRKTQTRRMVKRRCRDEGETIVCYPTDGWALESIAREFICPYGAPGDRLWVRETWGAHYAFDGVAPRDLPGGPVWYKAHGNGGAKTAVKRWRSPIHMPRRASRLTLEVVGIRVERLQDISEADAWAEGVEEDVIDQCVCTRNYSRPDAWFQMWAEYNDENFLYCPTEELARRSYRTLWESINGAGSWEANPYVWCVEFKRVQP